MIDHKISVQRFNRVEWKARLLTIMNNITLCNLCQINVAEIFQEVGITVFVVGRR